MVRPTTNEKEVTRKRRSGSVEFDDLLEGPIDAKQCLHLGEDDDKGQGKFERKAELLAYYLRDDAPAILNALADHLDSLADLPDEAPPQQLSFFGADEPYGRNDFDDSSDFSDTHRIMDLIRAGHTECEAIFIREVAKLMNLVGQTLDPQGKTPLQLVLKHRSRVAEKLDQIFWQRDFDTICCASLDVRVRKARSSDCEGHEGLSGEPGPDFSRPFAEEESLRRDPS